MCMVKISLRSIRIICCYMHPKVHLHTDQLTTAVLINLLATAGCLRMASMIVSSRYLISSVRTSVSGCRSG